MHYKKTINQLKIKLLIHFICERFKCNYYYSMSAYTKLRNLLKKWYQINKRALPWRENKDAYSIWVSEIILQQTQVVQGLDYYNRFMAQFPNVNALANANEQDVLKLWQGLGYYSRARNMHFASKQIVSEFNGKFPNTYANLLKLKGVGPYTASAIASIAFNLPHAVLDGNVMRVLARLFLVEEPINSSKGLKLLNELATELLDKNHPGDYNQAMMEFGALQCVPKNPDCITCPLNDSCMAFSEQMVTVLPIKTAKTKQRHRYFLYFVHQNNNMVWIKERGENDIWQGLYEFPMHESENPLNDEELLALCQTNKEITRIKHISKTYKHVLSHQIIHARFVVLESDFHSDTAIKIKKSSISEYPISRLTEKFLEDVKL